MTDLFLERLGWMLVHSVWQLAALATLLMLLLRVLTHASALVRYNCAALTLLAMIASLPLTCLFLVPPAGGLNTPRQFVAPLSGEIQDRSSHHTPPSDDRTMNEAALAPRSRNWDSYLPRWLAMRDRLAATIYPWAGTLVAVWLTGAVLVSLRPLVGWRAVRRLRTRGTSPASPDELALARGVAMRLGISRPIHVLHSACVTGPAVVGWLHPTVLLPLGISQGLTPIQLEGILAHELAHICRHDYLVNLMQTMAEALLFYHPAAWWVSHQMRVERESCCDETALALCPHRIDYARALLVLAENHRGLPAPAMAASGGSLLKRIRRIVQVTPPQQHASGLASAAVALCVCTCAALTILVAAPTVAEEPASDARATKRIGQVGNETTRIPPPGGKNSAEPAEPWVRGVAAEPWFWPDPYSHLGHDDAKGPGWRYVRIAADKATGQDLNTTDEQRRKIMQIYRDAEKRQAALGRALREEGKVDPAKWPARVHDLWLIAREEARNELSAAQHRRVEQLILQRQSYNVFRSEELARRLELTPEQHQKILASIDAHLQRIRDEDLELQHSAARAKDAPADAQLASQLQELKVAKEHRGRMSHRRVWDEIHTILLPAQREQFNQLRGPMAEPARQVLHHFQPKPRQ